MKTRTAGQRTKAKIARVSEKVFAEKGFDAARVDDIAKKAGVNKALIYYYFDSKENLLKEVLQVNALEIVKAIEEDFENANQENSALTFDFYMSIIDHLKRKRNVLKILMYEMLNPSNKKPMIFDILDMTFQSLKKLIDRSGNKIEDEETYKLNHFFYHFIPSMSFILIGDKYCNTYNVDYDNSFDKFIEAFHSLKLWSYVPSDKK
ncbi:MAG: TetR/AcrR family transcriptional regulator [Candidatus Delongbacteria bacterium]|nr:TetR/AcrR family transcriptional regulator [Candidatus Delongbacteria bacterium]MBN2834239.1 TetR/AcrR family transcriptional regulator [Candidatus Delongbacteria bacterium]